MFQKLILHLHFMKSLQCYHINKLCLWILEEYISCVLQKYNHNNHNKKVCVTSSTVLSSEFYTVDYSRKAINHSILGGWGGVCAFSENNLFLDLQLLLICEDKLCCIVLGEDVTSLMLVEYDIDGIS